MTPQIKGDTNSRVRIKRLLGSTAVSKFAPVGIVGSSPVWSSASWSVYTLATPLELIPVPIIVPEWRSLNKKTRVVPRLFSSAGWDVYSIS